MIYALGGPRSFLTSYKKDLNINLKIEEVLSNKNGWIKEINSRKLGLLLIELGGGRKQIDDKINYYVGYDNVLGIGDYVDKNTPIIKIFYSSEDNLNKIKDEIADCFILTDNKVEQQKNVYKNIN